MTLTPAEKETIIRLSRHRYHQQKPAGSIGMSNLPMTTDKGGEDDV